MTTPREPASLPADAETLALLDELATSFERDARACDRIAERAAPHIKLGVLADADRYATKAMRLRKLAASLRPDLTGETPPEPQSVVPVYHLRQIVADIASVAHYLIDGESKQSSALTLVSIAHRLNALDVKPWTDDEMAKLTRKAGRLVNANAGGGPPPETTREGPANAAAQ